MQIRELAIPDAYEITPTQHADDRGVFLEWYRFDRLEETIGHPLDLKQANTSVSRRGTVRGIHYALIPPSQAKYVTVMSGAAMDFVIDIRVGSPAFGSWDSVLLDSTERKALYIAEGIGHCFLALEDDTVLSYLVSATFDAEREKGLNPMDPEIGLNFPIADDELLLSQKDTDAPGLSAGAEQGILPTWEEARAFYSSQNDGRAGS